MTASMVREAALRIRSLARVTPVMTSQRMPDVFFKCENLQRGGAFKIRGAANLILSLTPDQVSRGVVAYSSGNHAQGVAIAAKHVGAKAIIVMPSDAPKSKVEPTRALGAEIVTYDRMRERREVVAEAYLQDGATLVPPYDHAMIIAGQGTAALELMSEVKELDTLVTCLGGGGLTGGCALIAKEINPAIRIFAVEPERGNDFVLSLRKGEPVEIAPPETIADGLRTLMPGKLTFPLVRDLVEEVVTVTDDELRETVRFFLMEMKMVVEPSGAAASAAIRHGKLPPGLGRVGAIISGGNVDFDFLKTL